MHVHAVRITPDRSERVFGKRGRERGGGGGLTRVKYLSALRLPSSRTVLSHMLKMSTATAVKDAILGLACNAMRTADNRSCRASLVHQCIRQPKMSSSNIPYNYGCCT